LISQPDAFSVLFSDENVDYILKSVAQLALGDRYIVDASFFHPRTR